MKLLLDTNIFIPLEPVSSASIAAETPVAMEFSRLVQRAAAQVYVHPQMIADVDRDLDQHRRVLRKTLFTRYPALPAPPSAELLDPSLVGRPLPGTNNFVDNALLAALKANACDFLITEDRGIHRKAVRLGIDDRVLLLQESVDLLAALFDKVPTPPPSVEHVYLHQVGPNEPILDSLRIDYPEFDEWFQKCQKEHREGYVVRAENHKDIAAIGILKREEGIEGVCAGKTLKICSFKVDPKHSGRRYGELLLRAIYDYAVKNMYKFTYFTTFEKQKQLMVFAEDFGFYNAKTSNERGEKFYVKDLDYSSLQSEQLNPWEFHYRFGPGVASFSGNASFVVPIQPEFHERLFPDLSDQLTIFGPDACGNSIKKAYLCNATISGLRRGDNLFFYRSKDQSSITARGVVEDAIRSDDANQIMRLVGTRTVYSFADIQGLAESPVLVIRFRHVGGIVPPIGLSELVSNGVLNGAPQSICQVQSGGLGWLRTRAAKSP